MTIYISYPKTKIQSIKFCKYNITQIKKDRYVNVSVVFRQLPMFPGGRPPSIFSVGKLNFCVRYGYRCVLPAIVTGYFFFFNFFFLPCFHWIEKSKSFFLTHFLLIWILNLLRSSPRPISIGQLNMLPCLHLRPIYHIVYVGPYLLYAMGNLILGGTSRLDAFSVYSFRT